MIVLLITACNRVEQTTLAERPDKTPTVIPIDSTALLRAGLLDSLISAAGNNNIELAKKLIQRGADANGRVEQQANYWTSPLSEATWRMHLDMVKLLVAHGADPNQDLGKNVTPFQSSVSRFRSELNWSDSVFLFLVKHRGDVNSLNSANGLTPIITAIQNDDISKVRMLIKAGAIINPDSVTRFQSPLASAIHSLREDIVLLLLRNGADVNARFSDASEDCLLCPYEITVLHTIVYMYRYADTKKVSQLLDLILKYRPDMNPENRYGDTPLQFAVYGDNLMLVDKLIRHGAKLETKYGSVIHHAATLSNTRMIEHLVKHYSFDINKQDQHGNTALLLCLKCCGDGFGEGITEGERFKSIELLLNNGADPSIKNNDGDSFLQLAPRQGFKKVNTMLIQRGLLTPQDTVISKSE